MNYYVITSTIVFLIDYSMTYHVHIISLCHRYIGYFKVRKTNDFCYAKNVGLIAGGTGILIIIIIMNK